MPSPFSGMDPYLENPALWPNVHGRLIVAISDVLSPLLLPKYQPIIEESVYSQRFTEIRNTANQEVVTVIEVLSPTNKKGDGRLRYLQKRDRLLESQANLIEIDFLHAGVAMPTAQNDVESHYRVLVSAVEQRPQAFLYPFNLPQPAPTVAIPLKEQDKAPQVDFQSLLNQVYERSGYEFSIDYTQPPKPSWNAAELSWIAKQAQTV